ncbi:hypothetical protein DL990_33350 [Amycolatopsis sp. WAC 01416]|nr:hypothetical protein DL990_33350 [Amycolatopsis sp. WAC 01416]
MTIAAQAERAMALWPNPGDTDALPLRKHRTNGPPLRLPGTRRCRLPRQPLSTERTSTVRDEGRRHILPTADQRSTPSRGLCPAESSACTSSPMPTTPKSWVT